LEKPFGENKGTEKGTKGDVHSREKKEPGIAGLRKIHVIATGRRIR